MKAFLDSLNRIRSVFPLIRILSSSSSIPKYFISSSTSSSSCSPSQTDESIEERQTSADLFRQCGCTDSEISKIFVRQPSLLKTDCQTLESKLNLLRGLGLTGSDLVKIINCRPRFLATRIGRGLDERIKFLEPLFGSREILLKAIIRNPSLLNYDLDKHIKKCVSLYQGLGVGREDLVPLLLSRPTLIPRSSLNEEKLEYIHRTGLTPDAKMYKYVVALIAISRLETIREKVANLEKFGFSNDEVIALFGRSPLVLTLSVDKVQRNMTFVIGTMKLPARLVLGYPFLLYYNLESVLRPRFLLAERIRLMGLVPQIKGPVLLRALRMTESRFIKMFVQCHSEDVGKELMQFYVNAKRIKRLAETSKRPVNKGFPF